MLFSKLFLVFLLTVASFPRALSHNWMTIPPPYNRVFNLGSCNEAKCLLACPKKYSRGMANSQEKPARVWERGQTVRVAWARNNHHGGMFRLALVPVEHMWDRAWHKKLTLLHGCWESGEHTCAPDEDCGTDKGKKAYERNVVIPNVFPDGDYVLGYVWYGGLHYKKEHGLFSDWYSCSHVRISGGEALGGSYKPFFEAGEGDDIVDGKCLTSADAVGDCDRDGCPDTKSFHAIPRVFQNGGPAPITPNTVLGKESNSPSNDYDNENSSPSPSPTPENETSEESEDIKENDGGTDGGSYEGEEEVNSGPVDKNGDGVDRGVCSGRVCCASRCGKCGGSGCHKRPGGGHECCMGPVKDSGRICSDDVGAPCMRS